MMWRRWISLIGLLLIAAVGVRWVSAHANAVQATPAPNAILDAAPIEIRMTFTEPLEPDFSNIRLRDRDGNIIETPASTVDPNNPTQMSLVPGNLPDGLYTVA